jgi:NAD(P)-dependent dehydrogenase (short-subunit alcohol dehydrogenase family)
MNAPQNFNCRCSWTCSLTCFRRKLLVIEQVLAKCNAFCSFLKEKYMRVCIAGVNQGLGLTLSTLLAENGHTVYGGYRKKTAPALSQAAGRFPQLKPLELDVTSEAQAEDAARFIEKDGGLLDAVIVVAGILPASDRERPITEAVIDDLRAALDIHAAGSAIMIKHFHKLVSDGGLFIIVTSEAGSMTNIGETYPAYSVSKAAQNKLTAVFAKTVSRFRVYALHPGRMNTVMGRANAQIEPDEAARGILDILSGKKKIPPEAGWFINYRGEAMEI